ncbi:trypsin-like peptidase domain-containing protein [Desulfobotulus sp. H1]|uniref:Trypsin-like peptidase domain-containing protein n=1 Tax=Desulfobotulus pelophilus TaxID=2823377 RepID=A0ABT3NBG5_9BACT|nr:trypsin-like peptidase domain-containing protein [Desulfobotulus pelophilus]MCW7754808.1 trypsin-like peptidase domain-containing protein [Desulfobotulus pelophilus]
MIKGKWILFCLCFLLPLQAQGSLPDRETPVVLAVRNVAPAVVNISAAYTETRHRSGFRDPFFDEFFRDFFEDGPEIRQQRTSLGSGVIIDGEKGYVLTNAHVVARGETITVTLENGSELPALLVGADTESDLAVLRIESNNSLPQAAMGVSRDLMIGEAVIAIGNPFGFSHTVTTGVISATNRHVRSNRHVFKRFIQTDASINPGNSGGPLLNIRGEVIGINTAIHARAQGIGFAIPIDRARRIAMDLIEHGMVIPLWDGLRSQEMDRDLAGYLGKGETEGLLVRNVEKNSPASRAGIRAGDVLSAMDGQPTTKMADYRELLEMMLPETPVRVDIIRKGKPLTLSMTLQSYPMERALDLPEKLMGIQAAEKPDSPRTVILTTIRKDSALDRAGARPGDRIRSLGEREITSLSDLHAALIRHRMDREVSLRIQRGNRVYTLTLPLES